MAGLHWEYLLIVLSVLVVLAVVVAVPVSLVALVVVSGRARAKRADLERRVADLEDRI